MKINMQVFNVSFVFIFIAYFCEHLTKSTISKIGYKKWIIYTKRLLIWKSTIEKPLGNMEIYLVGH